MTTPCLTQTRFIDPITEAHYAVHTTFESLSNKLHCHDFYEIFLVRHGCVHHIANGQEQILAAGALVFIRPDDAHYYRHINDDNFELVNLAFPQDVVNDLLLFLGDGFDSARFIDAPMPPTVNLTRSEFVDVAAQIDEVARIPYAHKFAVRVVLRTLLAVLFTRYFILAQLKPAASHQPPWLTQLCQHMQQPENFTVGVARMQALAHKTPEHLSRSFRRYLATTPTAYINDLRLNYAANLLIYTDRTVLDIAMEAGFDNLSYFYRLFKQQFGIAPAQFRKGNHQTSSPGFHLTAY